MKLKVNPRVKAEILRLWAVAKNVDLDPPAPRQNLVLSPTSEIALDQGQGVLQHKHHTNSNSRGDAAAQKHMLPRILLPWITQTVCPLYGVLTVVESGVLLGVCLRPRLSTAQARTEFRLRRQCRTDWWPRGFWSFCRVSVHFLKQDVVLRDRRKRSDCFRGSKRDFVCKGVRFQVSCWFLFESLVENARFGDLERRFLAHVSWKMRARIANVSRDLFVLELRILRFCGSLAERSFWKSGSSVFEVVSQKTLVLEVWIFYFCERLAVGPDV